MAADGWCSAGCWAIVGVMSLDADGSGSLGDRKSQVLRGFSRVLKLAGRSRVNRDEIAAAVVALAETFGTWDCGDASATDMRRGAEAREAIARNWRPVDEPNW